MDSTNTKALTKAQQAIDENQLWRARDILGGACQRQHIDSAVYSLLGEVYLKMGDLPAAGRYLFLSGVRKDEYNEAINFFVTKHSNDQFGLYYAIPKRDRLPSLAEYPLEVQKALESLNIPQEILDKNNFQSDNTKTSKSSKFLGSILGAFFIFSFIIGAIALLGGICYSIYFVIQALISLF